MKINHLGYRGSAAAVLLVATGMNPLVAQESRFEFGPQALLLLSQGEPSNDMLGGGLVIGWHWKDDWYFGAALEDMTYDYERPQRELNIAQDSTIKTIDGDGSFTRVSGWIERRYESNRAWKWFWGAGVGFSSPSAGVVSGPTAAGGTFNIVTDVSDELHLMGRTGLRRALGDRWMFTGTFHLEHHLTDYKIRDTISGATGTIGAHTPVGLSATFSYRF